MTDRDRGDRDPAAVLRKLLPAAAVAAALVLSGCGSSTSKSAAASTFSPNPSNFSGSPPSALASAASSALASVSAAASSASAAAASFEASVAAQVDAGRAEATNVLYGVSGSGNATSDVTLTGVPKTQSGGLNAAVVTITNSTGATASYAVRVEWIDSSVNVVDESVIGVKNLAPGAKKQPIAFTTKSPDAALVPRVAQAQRY